MTMKITKAEIDAMEVLLTELYPDKELNAKAMVSCPAAIAAKLPNLSEEDLDKVADLIAQIFSIGVATKSMNSLAYSFLYYSTVRGIEKKKAEYYGDSADVLPFRRH